MVDVQPNRLNGVAAFEMRVAGGAQEFFRNIGRIDQFFIRIVFVVFLADPSSCLTPARNDRDLHARRAEGEYEGYAFVLWCRRIRCFSNTALLGYPCGS